MDSGIVGADGNRDFSEDLPKKSEVCIVYTRKNRIKAPSNRNSDAPAPVAAEPSVVSLGSASAEPSVSTIAAGNCNLADEGSVQVVLETIPAGQDGNLVEQQGAVVDSHDTENLAKESRCGKEALPNGEVELQLPRDLEHREERRFNGATGGEGCLLSEESKGGGVALPNGGAELDPEVHPPGELELREEGQLSRVTNGEERLLDGGKELLSNYGKELDPYNRKDTNGEVANRSELQVDLSVSQVESWNNNKELHRNGVSTVISRNSVLKPLSSVTGDRVRIVISESSSKVELRGLKRKIENELDQVRIVMKKLEDKSLQTTSFNTNITTDRPTYISSNAGYYKQPQLMRVNSMIGGGGHPQTRPFRQLSVSVMENNHGVGEFFEKEKRTPKANKFYLNSEFLLGKDRLPPESNNKKHKRNGDVTKHGFGVVDKNREKVFRSCSNLLQRLMKHKHGWVFNSPVDADKLGLHDYHDIIKHPMDFDTIKTRLSENWYRSARQFAEDVRLVFRNAMTYNPKGQDVHTMAEELSSIFEDKWASIERDSFPYQMYYPPTILAPLSIPTPRSVPPMRTFDRSKSLSMPITTRPFVMDIIPQTVRTPPVLKKPKAKDPNKRDMTYEEKQKLSTNLQSLPVEKLDSVVQIIKKRTSGLSQHNDEIEVDIDNVDAESLWELDRFLANYKKGLSKNKRKAQQALAVPPHGLMQTNPTPATLDEQREGATESVQVTIPGDNASSSSSSSSDSGSSSSDSDSDSSSASEDAAHSPKT